MLQNSNYMEDTQPRQYYNSYINIFVIMAEKLCMKFDYLLIINNAN